MMQIIQLKVGEQLSLGAHSLAIVMLLVMNEPPCATSWPPLLPYMLTLDTLEIIVSYLSLNPLLNIR